MCWLDFIFSTTRYEELILKSNSINSIHDFLEFERDSKIVERVRVAEKHFTTYLHWYDTNSITESQTLLLKLQNVMEDEDYINNWPSFVEDLTTEPTMTLATIGLAVYNVLFANIQVHALLTHRKIFVR